MAVWDFSQEGTRERMQQRAAHDAFYAVNHYWPHERIEPLPGMPQDIELWARKMAQRFMSGTLVFPAWALVTEETANRTYFQVLYDYFNVCYYELRRAVMQRIFETGWIPGDTTTPEEMAPNRPRRSVHGRQTPPPVFAEAPKPPKKKRRPADDLPPGIPDETEP